MISNNFVESLSSFGVNIDKVDISAPVVFIGTLFSKENKELVDEILKSGNKIIYLSPIEDNYLHKNEFLYIKYEIGSEAGVLALLLKEFFEDDNSLDKSIKAYINELDEGYLSAESSVSEEEIEELFSYIKKASKCTFVFGADIYNHPNAKEIAGIVSLLTISQNISVSMIDNFEQKALNSDRYLPQIDELESYDGSVVYLQPHSDNSKLFGSIQFSVAAKIKDTDIVDIKVDNGTFTKEFSLDEKMKGTIAVLPTKDKIIGYRYKKAKITRKVLNE